MNPKDGSVVDARVLLLTAQAEQLVAEHKLQEATRCIQEAVSLRPGDARVLELIKNVQRSSNQEEVAEYIQRYLIHGNENDAKQALAGLQLRNTIPPDAFSRCFDLIAARSSDGPDLALLDQIASKLICTSGDSRRCLAQYFLAHYSEEKRITKILQIGDSTGNAFYEVLIGPQYWDDESQREAIETEVFVKLLQSLDDKRIGDTARTLKGIVRLLASDGIKLVKHIEKGSWTTILSCLDYRQTVQIKTSATVVLAKCIEIDLSGVQEPINNYIIHNFAQQTSECLILAFSATASLFPLAPEMASSLFLAKGFISSLQPLLDKFDSHAAVIIAVLELFNAACIDGACRVEMKKHCTSWLEEVSRSASEEAVSRAAVILVKLRADSAASQDGDPLISDKDNQQMIERLVQMMFQDPKKNLAASIEGLAHASIRPSVKEFLINDRRWLSVFLTELGAVNAKSTCMYGGLVILDNLTGYIPEQSEEEKRMMQLRAYANAEKSAASERIDPLNENKAVQRRCDMIISADVSAVLFGKAKHLTLTTMALVMKISLALTRSPRILRQKLVQQGAIKTLASMWHSVSSDSQSDEIQGIQKAAAQAIARLLITTDPAVYFGPNGNATLQSVMIPLISLLTAESKTTFSAPQNQLPLYETLLALTNLASVPTNGATEIIMAKAQAAVEDHTLSSNIAIQRASVELICNLVQCPAGIAMYADGSVGASRRLHILLALADAEDVATRKAAGGALASLVPLEPIIKSVMSLDRGIILFLTMLDDEDSQVLHRGLVCLICALDPTMSTTPEFKEKVQKEQVLKKLDHAEARNGNRELHDLFVEARAALTI